MSAKWPESVCIHEQDQRSESLVTIALQVELFGGEIWRVERQEYRVGITYIMVVGTPLYNFAAHTSLAHVSPEIKLSEVNNSDLPRPKTNQHVSHDVISKAKQGSADPGAVLQYIHPDPLREAGGLHRVSEMGRLQVPKQQICKAVAFADRPLFCQR